MAYFFDSQDPVRAYKRPHVVYTLLVKLISYKKRIAQAVLWPPKRPNDVTAVMMRIVLMPFRQVLSDRYAYKFPVF